MDNETDEEILERFASILQSCVLEPDLSARLAGVSCKRYIYSHFPICGSQMGPMVRPGSMDRYASSIDKVHHGAAGTKRISQEACLFFFLFSKPPVLSGVTGSRSRGRCQSFLAVLGGN